MSITVLAVLAAGAVTLALSPLFAVTELLLTGVEGSDAELVRAVAGLDTGDNLLRLDLAAAERRVEQLSWVRDASVTREPPSTVRITVTPRRAEVVVLLAESAWLVDSDGYVIGGGTEPGLVPIEARNSVLPGVGSPTRDAAILNALAVHRALPSRLRDMLVGYHAPSDRGLRLRLAPPGLDPLWVRFGVADRAADKAGVLLALLDDVVSSSSATGGPSIATIDVRAPGNPVLIPAG